MCFDFDWDDVPDNLGGPNKCTLDLLKKVNGFKNMEKCRSLMRAMTQGYITKSSKERCNDELTRQMSIPQWWFVSADQLMANHDKVDPGMMYGIEFPWTEEMLMEWGPEWLTRAFQTAGTLGMQNRVTKIIPDSTDIHAGINGTKFLFGVEYAVNSPNLHTKLFCKCPHPMTKSGTPLRIRTSVNMQGTEYAELNFHRLLEAFMPCKVPKFYYGDVSNQTTNFIIICEALPFDDDLEFLHEPPEVPRGPRKPFDLEGPYEKCADWNMRGNPIDYYHCMMRKGGLLAGTAAANRLGNPAVLQAYFNMMRPQTPKEAGVGPDVTGQKVTQLATLVKMFLNFMTQEGKVIMPSYITDPKVLANISRTILTINAYQAEANWYRFHDKDMIHVMHGNLNPDNCYFWRDEDGNLDCGLLDFGGFGGARSLGAHIWWGIFTADYDTVIHMDEFTQTFADAFHEAGGPRLSMHILKHTVRLTCLEHLTTSFVGGIPKIFQQCPKKEWATIENRWDKRLSGQIDGSHFLRATIQMTICFVRLIQEFGLDMWIKEWIAEVTTMLNMEPKKVQMDPTIAQTIKDIAGVDALDAEDDVQDTALSSKQRCEKEIMRQWDLGTWQQVDQSVLEKHMNVTKGMMYGLEFPWTEEQLHSDKFGAEWLTMAFRTAGTLGMENEVTKISPLTADIHAGINGTKFLFDVEYLIDAPHLHKRMFVKCPHPMTPTGKPLRIRSSIRQQGMEYSEINFHRLLEGDIPVKVAKFYYGDISNETTNFIIICGALEFDDEVDYQYGPRKVQLGPRAPFKLEGPYEKCADWNFRGDGTEEDWAKSAVEYYICMLRTAGKVAGAAASGKMGDEGMLKTIFGSAQPMPPEWMGVHGGVTGQPENILTSMMKLFIEFITNEGTIAMPSYIKDEAFLMKLCNTIMLTNQYLAEVSWYRFHDPDQIHCHHVNVNPDNAFFWRDADGNLDCGLLDWAGFGANMSMARGIWWAIFTADYETIRHMDVIIQAFIDACEEMGGPRLDFRRTKIGTLLTGMEHLTSNFLGGIPQVWRFCPKKEWPTIKDRWDPRISGQIQGSHFMRSTVQMSNMFCRLIEEFKVDEILRDWTAEVDGMLERPPKPSVQLDEKLVETIKACTKGSKKT